MKKILNVHQVKNTQQNDPFQIGFTSHSFVSFHFESLTSTEVMLAKFVPYSFGQLKALGNICKFYGNRALEEKGFFLYLFKFVFYSFFNVKIDLHTAFSLYSEAATLYKEASKSLCSLSLFFFQYSMYIYIY